MDGAAPPLIEAQAVRKEYARAAGPPFVALDGVSLTLREGEIVGLLGRSGCGKSTLLRILAGLASPTGGTVLHQGRAIPGPAPGVAMVFQTFALFPWLTVLENVELGLDALGTPADVKRKRALAAIDLIGLDGFESALPLELSGGMRQRVGLARALVVHPAVLLLDEPFSALDVLTADTLRTDLLDLWSEGRMPIKAMVMVTHNIDEAVLMCDRVVLLASSPGRVAAEMAIDLPQPRHHLDPDFRAVVDRIYARLTETREATHRPAAHGGVAGIGIGMVLPRVSANALSGLLETVAGPPFRGTADLPHVAARLHMEVDDLFPIAEALQLLRLAEMSEGDISLTEPGRRYVDADRDARKRLFGESLLAHVPIVALIRRVLDERRGHKAPFARFREELEDHMTERDAERTLRAAIGWGRFAEAFAYDERSATFSLENPS